MPIRKFIIAACATLSALALALAVSANHQSTRQAAPHYGRLPLRFEANRG